METTIQKLQVEKLKFQQENEKFQNENLRLSKYVKDLKSKSSKIEKSLKIEYEKNWTFYF